MIQQKNKYKDRGFNPLSFFCQNKLLYNKEEGEEIWLKYQQMNIY